MYTLVSILNEEEASKEAEVETKKLMVPKQQDELSIVQKLGMSTSVQLRQLYSNVSLKQVTCSAGV